MLFHGKAKVSGAYLQLPNIHQTTHLVSNIPVFIAQLKRLSQMTIFPPLGLQNIQHACHI
jgi:hypothetical protein